MPWFESALARVSPSWALRRLQARMVFDQAARAYDAARPSRGTKGWITSSASAIEEVGPALRVLRDRSRDIVRNNPWGVKIRRQLPAHLVGKGITPRPTGGAESTRSRALAHWNEWADATDVETDIGFPGQQALIAGTIVESGEALLLWEADARAPGGWRTRVLEGDYLDETLNEDSRNGSGRIVSGIEFDAAGRRVAYHLFREHPGDSLRVYFARATDRVRVDARFVDHVFEVLRPGQVRGVPWMAASGLRLRDVDDYMDAERWRKKIAAALAVFVTSPATPAQSGLGAVRSEEGPDGARRGIERIMPGTIKRLQAGEDVKLSTPPADAGITDYLRAELLAIAAGIGVPYAEMTGDLSTANYSSMRAGKMEFWALLDAWQAHMLRPMLLRRAWRRVMATGPAASMPCEWGFPKRMWVDPLKDAQAEVLAIQAGLVSQPDAIAARGDDWRETVREQAEFLAAAREAGLVLETDLAAGRPAAPAPALGADQTDDAAPAAAE